MKPLSFLSSASRTLLTLCLSVASLSTALAQWTPNAQEQQIGSLLSQRRARMVVDPILSRVARERAADMARRGYFDHVNPDGVAANHLVRSAGYPLPAWWGTDRSANYIESIAAGVASASGTWDQWMASSGHKTHLLALDSFYADQTRYGVGFVSDPASRYRYYWVVLTAPPPPNPSLAIVAPANGAKLVNSSAAVAGTANGESGVQTVEVRVENALGVGAFSPAVGTTNWRASLAGLAPGANVIRVRTRKADGSVIAEMTRSVTYVVTSDLNIAVEGMGTVSAGFAGTTVRAVGSVLNVVATPRPGYLFAGWSGDVSASARAIRFTMGEHMSLTAKFVVDIFRSTQGAYRGLINSGGQQGMVRFALTPSGVFSGNVILGSVAHRFAGAFSSEGTAAVELLREGASPLTLSLKIDTENLNSGIIGSLSDGASVADFTADRAAYHALRKPAPLRGRYTVRFAATTSASGDVLPTGSGFGLLTIRPGGEVLLVGRMSDDTPFTQSTTLSAANELPVFVPTAANGTVLGSLSLAASVEAPIGGSLDWNVPVEAGEPMSFTLQPAGSRYVAARAGQRLLGLVNATVSLEGGNLAEASIPLPLVQSAFLTKTHRFAIAEPNTYAITMAVQPASGMVYGSITHPVTGTVRPIRGVVLQNQNAAFGYFLGADESGSVAVTAAAVE